MDLGILPDWLPKPLVAKMIIIRFCGDKERGNKEFLKALKSNQIRNGGEMIEFGNRIEYRNVHFLTSDVMAWLDRVAPIARA